MTAPAASAAAGLRQRAGLPVLTWPASTRCRSRPSSPPATAGCRPAVWHAQPQLRGRRRGGERAGEPAAGRGRPRRTRPTSSSPPRFTAAAPRWWPRPTGAAARWPPATRPGQPTPWSPPRRAPCWRSWWPTAYPSSCTTPPPTCSRACTPVAGHGREDGAAALAAICSLGARRGHHRRHRSVDRGGPTRSAPRWRPRRGAFGADAPGAAG